MSNQQQQLPTSDERLAAAACHASALLGTVLAVGQFIVPIIFMCASNSPFVVQQAKEALNFQISLWLWILIFVCLTIGTLGLALVIVVPMAIVFAVLSFVLPIIAAITTASGKPYRYHLIWRLVG